MGFLDFLRQLNDVPDYPRHLRTAGGAVLDALDVPLSAAKSGVGYATYGAVQGEQFLQDLLGLDPGFGGRSAAEERLIEEVFAKGGGRGVWEQVIGELPAFSEIPGVPDPLKPVLPDAFPLRAAVEVGLDPLTWAGGVGAAGKALKAAQQGNRLGSLAGAGLEKAGQLGSLDVIAGAGAARRALGGVPGAGTAAGAVAKAATPLTRPAKKVLGQWTALAPEDQLTKDLDEVWSGWTEFTNAQAAFAARSPVGYIPPKPVVSAETEALMGRTVSLTRRQLGMPKLDPKLSWANQPAATYLETLTFYKEEAHRVREELLKAGVTRDFVVEGPEFLAEVRAKLPALEKPVKAMVEAGLDPLSPRVEETALARFEKALGKERGIKPRKPTWYDTFVGMWKEQALFSGRYLGANALGNSIQNVLGGVWPNLNPADFLRAMRRVEGKVGGRFDPDDTAWARTARKWGREPSRAVLRAGFHSVLPERHGTRSVIGRQAGKWTGSPRVGRAVGKPFEAVHVAASALDQMARGAVWGDTLDAEMIRQLPEVRAKIQGIVDRHNQYVPGWSGTVYHGSPNPTLRRIKSNLPDQTRQFSAPDASLGAFFTPDPETARLYGTAGPASSGVGSQPAGLYSTNLSLRRPYEMTFDDKYNLLGSPEKVKAFREKLVSEGYDGIIFRSGTGLGPGYDEVVSFRDVLVGPAKKISRTPGFVSEGGQRFPSPTGFVFVDPEAAARHAKRMEVSPSGSVVKVSDGYAHIEDPNGSPIGGSIRAREAPDVGLVPIRLSDGAVLPPVSAIHDSSRGSARSAAVSRKTPPAKQLIDLTNWVMPTTPEGIRRDLTDLGLPSGQAKRAAQALAEAGNKAEKAALAAMERTQFSYLRTNLDRKIERIVPFHYWASRATRFYGEELLSHPVLPLNWARMMEGLDRAAEDPGLDASLRGYLKLFTTPAGFTLFLNPTALVGVSFAMGLGQDAYTPEGETRAGAVMRTLRQYGVGLYPWFDALFNYMGTYGDTFEPEPFGIRHRALFGAAVNKAASEGWLGIGETNPWWATLNDGLRQEVSFWAGMALPDWLAQPVAMSAGGPTAQISLDGIIESRIIANNPDLTNGELVQIMSTPDDPRYEEAFQQAANAGLIQQLINITAPVGARMREGSREARSRGLTAIREEAERRGLAPWELTPTTGDAQFMALFEAQTGQRFAADSYEKLQTRSDLTRATPEGKKFVVWEQEYHAIGDPQTRAVIERREEIASGRWVPPGFAPPRSLDEARRVAERWVALSGYQPVVERYNALRRAYRQLHPEFDRYMAWKGQMYDVQGLYGSLEEYRARTAAANPAFARYLEGEMDFVRRTFPETEWMAEMDRRTMNADAYLAVLGLAGSRYDPLGPGPAGAYDPAGAMLPPQQPFGGFGGYAPPTVGDVPGGIPSGGWRDLLARYA